MYAKNERNAVRMLTERIGFELKQLTLIIEHEELKSFVPVIQALYEKELIEQSPIELPKEKKAFQIRKDIIQGMHFFDHYFPVRSKRIKKSLDEYHQLLLSFKIKDKWLDSNFQKSYRPLSLSKTLFYLGGLPVFLYGLINHLGILKLTPLIVGRIIKRPDFKGSLLLSYGVLCFFFFYGLQISLFAWLTSSVIWTLVYIISLPLTGSFVMHYVHKLAKDKDALEFNRYLKNNHQILKSLKDYREHLLDQLRLARQDYLTFSKKV
jgi:hypothetical protein